MRVLQIGIAAIGKSADQVQRRRRLPIRHDLPLRIGDTRRGGEFDPVDHIPAIGRQFHITDFLVRRGARLGKLPRNAAHLHHGRRACKCQHNGHLQKQPEKIADIVSRMLGKALGAIAALQQKRIAIGNLAQSALQLPRLACKNQRRKPGQLRLDGIESCSIRKRRHLLNRF